MAPRCPSSALDLATQQPDGSRRARAPRARSACAWARSRFAPFAALHAELIPSPAEIFALPRGVAGHTPYVWIGASAGGSVGSCDDAARLAIARVDVVVCCAGGGCGPELDLGSDVLWTGLFEAANFDEWTSDRRAKHWPFREPPT